MRDRHYASALHTEKIRACIHSSYQWRLRKTVCSLTNHQQIICTSWTYCPVPVTYSISGQRKLYGRVKSGELQFYWNWYIILKPNNEALNLQVSCEPLCPSNDHIARGHAAVTDLMFGRNDLTSRGLAITSLLLDAVDCLSSYFMSGSKAFFPCPQPVSRLHKISQIFAVSAWLRISFVLSSLSHFCP